MKKYLMTVMAAVALGGLFSGCGNDVDLSGGSTAEFNIVQNYENAFITRFGQPAATQTWGFGSASAGTRAVVDHPYISDGGDTYNATIAKAWQGVNAAIASGTPASYFDFMNDLKTWENSGWADKYYDVHGTVVPSDLNSEYVASALKVIVGTPEEPGLIPENQNNLGKAQSTGYSIVTTGGPVTLTPIYHNSNSGDRLCYYYYPEGQKPSAEQIKTMRKYSLGEMSNPVSGGNTHLYNNTYSLVYVDANGNCSYDFPEGYVINFVISNTWGGISKDVYQSGGVTTTTTAQLTSQGKYQVEADRYYSIGENVNSDIAEIRFGKEFSIPKFTMKSQAVGGFYSDAGNHFEYLMEGNSVNGDLNGGSTVYYFQPTVNGIIRIGVSLNANKSFYIKNLGVDGWNNTSGTSLDGFDGLKVDNKYDGMYKFQVSAKNVYAVYATGSKLGFYGFEFQTWNTSWNNWGTPVDDGVFKSSMGPFNCGDEFQLGQVKIRLGRKPIFEKTKTNGQVSGYSALTEGTSVNGGLSADCATTYYIKPKKSGEMEVAVALNSGKQFYIKDLGVDGWNSTSGTSVSGYDGITEANKYYGKYRFPVEAGHVYAVYADGSKLGFYGCELFASENSGSQSSVSDIVKTSVATKPDYYSDGTLNQEVHSSTALGYGLNGFGESSSITNPQVSHTAVFKSGDYTFVGFEDWVDFDYNDVIFAITGTEPETPQEEIVIPDPEEEETTDPGTFVCRIVAEDLTVGENSDFDFNDVVFDVFCDGSTTTIRLRAAGGELPLYVAGHEVHKEFGYNSSYPIINTGWDGTIEYEKRYVDFTISGVYNTRALANTIQVYVTKRGEDKELKDILLTAREGKVASKVCVGRDYEWCSERLDVDNKFHKQDGTKLFQQYVVGNFGDNWDAGTAWYQFRGK